MARYLVSLRDAMHEFSNSVSPHSTSPSMAHPQPSNRASLPFLQRRAACTHTTLGRLYGPYRCSHCGRVPRCGWVYRCTQDYDGELPSWEARISAPPGLKDPCAVATDREKRMLKVVNGDSRSADRSPEESEDDEERETPLKPWMDDAIAKGCYTDEQVELLRKQRQRVLDAIQEAEMAHQVDQLATGRRHLHEVASNSAPNLRSLTGRKKRGSSGSMRSNVPLKTFPDCQYRTCSSCRPLSRDRAWACVDEAHSSVAEPLTNLARDTRPIALADHVQNLGLRPPVQCLSLLSIPSLPSEDGNAPVLVGVPETEAASQHHSHAMPSFMQRVEAEMSRDLHNAFRTPASPPPSPQHSASRPGDELDATFLRNLAAMDVTASQQLPRAYLEEDLTVSTGAHDTEANGVHVKDGVAVTEEAVDMGTADVIMQV